MRNYFKPFLCFFWMGFSVLPFAYADDKADGEKFRALLTELIEASNPVYTREETVRNINATLEHHQINIGEWILRLQMPQSLLNKSKLDISPSNAVANLNLLSKAQSIINTVDVFNYPLIMNTSRGTIHTLAPYFSRFVLGLHLDAALTTLPYGQVVSQGLESKIGDWIFALSTQMNKAIENMDLSQSDIMAVMIDKTIQDDFEQLGRKYQDFFQKVIAQYFHHISLQMKRRILIAYLSTPIDAPLETKLLAITQNCGPVMKKFLQFAANYFQSPQVREVLQKLKTHVRKDSPEEVQAVLQHTFGPRWNDISTYLSPDPLNSGTIGQVHVVKLRGSDQDHIAKVQHKYARIEARDELRALRQLKGLGKWGQDALDKVSDSTARELDFRIEAGNMEKARVYNHPEKRIVPTHVVQNLYGKMAVVINRAPGKNIDSWSAADLNQMNISQKEFLALKMHLIYEFTEIWIRETIFGSGFFHGDPHEGNFQLYLGASGSLDIETRQDLGLVDRLFEKQLPAVWKNREFLLTVMDFGNCGNLTLQEQTAIKEIVLGLLTGWPKIIISGIKKIGQFTQSNTTGTLDAEVNQIAMNTHVSFYDKFQRLNQAMIDRGILLPPSFHTFNSARVFLQQHLDKINSELNQLDPEQEIPRVYPGLAYIKGTLLSFLDYRNAFRNLMDSKWIIQYLFNLMSDVSRGRYSKLQFIGENCVSLGSQVLGDFSEDICPLDSN